MIGERASSTIREAELRIRDLVAEATASGDYGMVTSLVRVASSLSGLAELAEGRVASVGGASLSSGEESKHQSRTSRASAAARKKSRKVDYPRFESSCDRLVKIGWSKRERTEYVHKVPLEGVNAVIDRVLGLGNGGRTFTIEDLLPVKLGSGGDELPGYQVYICVAWLRAIGALERHGRAGYSIRSADVKATADEAWKVLQILQQSKHQRASDREAA